MLHLKKSLAWAAKKMKDLLALFLKATMDLKGLYYYVGWDFRRNTAVQCSRWKTRRNCTLWTISYRTL